MIIKSNSKMDAAKALANTIIKMDKHKYCNNCGAWFIPEQMPCCEEPMIGDHLMFCKAIMRQNKEVMASQRNVYGSTDNNTLRWGVSVPTYFFQIFCKAFKKIYGVNLFDKESKGKDLRDFMRKFPYFRVCERI